MLISTIYNAAISALLDDFPRYHTGSNQKLKEEYLASVPLSVQNACLERWNKYVWDMSFLKAGEMFISSAFSSNAGDIVAGYEGSTATTTTAPAIATVVVSPSPSVSATADTCHNTLQPPAGIAERSSAFSFLHAATCDRDCVLKPICESRVRTLLLEQWSLWWDHETLRKGRHVPRPSRVRRLLASVEEMLEEVIAEGVEEGLGWECARGVREEVVGRLEKVVGRGVGRGMCGWEVEEGEDEDEEEEIWVGLRLEEEA